MKTIKNKNPKPSTKAKDQNKNDEPVKSKNEVDDGLGSERDVETDDSDFTMDSNLNEDDLDALGPEDLSMDGGDDEDLAHRIFPVDFAGKDLEVPGSELDDDQEDIGSEDEENNFYSHGGV